MVAARRRCCVCMAYVVFSGIKWIKGALIGSGSFGKVYLGMDATNGLLMAVKQVELAGSMNNDRKRSMIREKLFKR